MLVEKFTYFHFHTLSQSLHTNPYFILFIRVRASTSFSTENNSKD